MQRIVLALALTGAAGLIAPQCTVRAPRAVLRAEASKAEQQQELMATNVFNSVVMYTPRGHHGSSQDMSHNYPVEQVRIPSLAASAREAQELNDAADAEAKRKHDDWLHYGKHGKDPEAG